MSKIDIFFPPCSILMQWSGPQQHGVRLAMFACTGVAFQSVPMHGTGGTFLLGRVSSGTFFFVFSIAVGKCIRTHVIGT